MSSGAEAWRARLTAVRFAAEPRRAQWVWKAVGRVGAVADPLLGQLFGRGLDDTSARQTEPEHFHPDRVWYEPSGWTDLQRVLRRREVHPSDVFIDLGSGKGRVVYQAARRYRFARVIGVEVSPRLNAIAQANLERRSARLACRDFELITADLMTFRIPDDVTVAYYYYAFVGETFRAVVDEILASIDRHPRELRLIARLVAPEYLEETGRFELVRRVRFRANASKDMGISLYRAGPRSVGHAGGAQ